MRKEKKLFLLKSKSATLKIIPHLKISFKRNDLLFFCNCIPQTDKMFALSLVFYMIRKIIAYFAAFLF